MMLTVTGIYMLRVQKKMFKAKELTACEDKNLDLVIAVSYGGRWDILEAAKKIRDIKDKKIEINEELMNSFTSLSSFSDPLQQGQLSFLQE